MSLPAIQPPLSAAETLTTPSVPVSSQASPVQPGVAIDRLLARWLVEVALVAQPDAVPDITTEDPPVTDPEEASGV